MSVAGVRVVEFNSFKNQLSRIRIDKMDFFKD